MARDYDRAASRFLEALRRIGAGIVRQRERILDRADNAPRLLPGSPHEVIDLTGDEGNDLDYYIFELARLNEVGKSVIRVFGRPQELLDAQRAFEDVLPSLREIRNSLIHPNDNEKLDNVAFFSSVLELLPGGEVRQLVDPRYGQHNAAMEYHAVLTAYLRARVAAAIRADPPGPIRRTSADDDTQQPHQKTTTRR
ncbi:hypothetical protein ACFWN2_25840 [Lentzea sp. NPDC058436]|uniref:hypothetical protein n=1 Tax=Lentzea sp. NPDC058436 TaxID=3346499 RepID=UPI00366282AC